MSRPLLTEADDTGLVVTLGPDAARQVVRQIFRHLYLSPSAQAEAVKALTGAEIHLTGEDVDAFADSTADAHEIHAADPARVAEQDATDPKDDDR